MQVALDEPIVAAAKDLFEYRRYHQMSVSPNL
jgi:hypothetical protein